jgi:pantoate--beta-alanine ligase
VNPATSASFKPLITSTIDETYDRIVQARESGLVVGFVPTMGALHAGHLSLIDEARRQSDFVVVSVFVNPTQFDQSLDLEQYPRTLQRDVDAMSDYGVDLVFAPMEDEIYPDGFSTTVTAPRIANCLEGECRPGHFDGVATVVLKLFQIVPADQAYFGEKDFQQLLVVRAMVRDLNLPIRIYGCPTVREADGLAMSSRNARLSSEQRQQALAISRGLRMASAQFATGERNPKRLEHVIAEELRRSGVDQIDYVAVRCAQKLIPLENIDRPAVALVAARVGPTRLIDNRRLDEEASSVLP